jgi:NTP pyrophosphatase (non-canonical NTP hydrolase)
VSPTPTPIRYPEKFLENHQQQVMASLLVKPEIDPLSHAALGLAGAAGEVADQIKKSQYNGRELDTEKLLEELGDALWYLQYIAGSQGWSLEYIAWWNLVKLKQRHPAHYTVPAVTSPEDGCKSC